MALLESKVSFTTMFCNTTSLKLVIVVKLKVGGATPLYNGKNILGVFFSILCLTSIYNIYSIKNLAIVIQTQIYILIQIDGSYNEK